LLRISLSCNYRKEVPTVSPRKTLSVHVVTSQPTSNRIPCGSNGTGINTGWRGILNITAELPNLRYDADPSRRRALSTGNPVLPAISHSAMSMARSVL